MSAGFQEMISVLLPVLTLVYEFASSEITLAWAATV
jgi:hypothetical protein